MAAFRFPGPAPARLDVVLGRMCPLGRRGRQQLIEAGRVLVDGRPGRKGALVQPGQWVTITGDNAASPGVSMPAARLLAQTDAFAALAKPAGMPSVRGASPGSLEEALPLLGLSGWQLLNRLDTPTSGVVLAAATPAAAAQYHAWQEEGRVRKWYLAVVHGHCTQARTCTARIDDARRRRVRVLPEPDPSLLRHTHIWPLCHEADSTLVLVRILKGRRHHIRAHLAACGHPIVGDGRYGTERTEGGLFLHHAALVFPEFTVRTPPDWPQWQSLARTVPVHRLPADFFPLWPIEDPSPAASEP